MSFIAEKWISELPNSTPVSFTSPQGHAYLSSLYISKRVYKLLLFHVPQSGVRVQILCIPTLLDFQRTSSTFPIFFGLSQILGNIYREKDVYMVIKVLSQVGENF